MVGELVTARQCIQRQSEEAAEVKGQRDKARMETQASHQTVGESEQHCRALVHRSEVDKRLAATYPLP